MYVLHVNRGPKVAKKAVSARCWSKRRVACCSKQVVPPSLPLHGAIPGSRSVQPARRANALRAEAGHDQVSIFCVCRVAFGRRDACWYLGDLVPSQNLPRACNLFAELEEERQQGSCSQSRRDRSSHFSSCQGTGTPNGVITAMGLQL